MKYKVLKSFQYSLLAVGISLLFLGCSKFDQDFQVKPVNEITIEATVTSMTAVQFEQLRIPVTITSSQPEKSKYKYTWKAISDDSVYTISQVKDLDVKVELPPKRYNLQFTVIDEENNLAYSKMFSLTVTGVFFEGWLVSHNMADKGRLSFVRKDNIVFENPAEEINHMVLAGKVIASYYAEIPFYGQYASIHYFTENAVYRFDPASFLLTGTTKNVFISQTSFSKPIYGAGMSGIDQYYVDNGDVYAGMGSFTPTQISMPFSEGLGGDYELFPVIISSVYSGTYFYDNKYKRFLQLPYLDRELIPVSGSNEQLYNMGNVGKTMIAADQGRNSGSSTIFYFIMEDNTGRYFLGLNGDKPSIYQKMENNKSPGINQATSFATSSLLQHMYYAVENKIYLYNMVANTAELLYSFPSGHQIKDIEMKRNTSKTLAVATSIGGAGEFHIFDLNDLGHFTGDAPSKTLKGFGDIVHISIR